MTLDDLTEKYEKVRLDYQHEVIEGMSEEQFQEYSEILFSTHSCAIEGNSFSVDDTRTLKELGLSMVPQNKKLFECVEMADHLKAFEYVIANLHHPLNEEFLKEVNRLITNHTLSYRCKDAIPGEYTKEDMAAGDTVFGDHKKLIARVPQLLDSTEKALNGGTHPMVVAARFHGYYEYLHPFRDGNGITGRLLSNYILLRQGHPLLTIYLSERQQYISALKQIRIEGTDEFLIDFFFTTAIKHMEEDIKQKKQNTKPKLFLF